MITLHKGNFRGWPRGQARRLLSTSEHTARLICRPRPSGLRGALTAEGIPADVWITGALVLAAAVIRIVVINNQSLWWDESLTAYEVRLPFGAMIHTVEHVETTPPLYFVLIWVWAHLFGTGEVALRALSTLAGIALVPIAYLCGRELCSRRAGLLTAAFVTVNPFLIWYSQEARAYMLLAALTAASFLWFLRARRDLTRANLAVWALWSSLAVMTHFFAGFAIAPEALWLLWIARTRVVIGAVATVAIVQAAMLPFAGADTSHGVGWIGRIPRLHRIAMGILEWGVSTANRRTTFAVGLAAGAILAAAVTLLLARGGDQRTKAGARVALAVAGFVLLVPLALGFVGHDYFLSRNLIPAFIPLATVLAAACLSPRARPFGAILAISLLAIFSAGAVVVQTAPDLQRPDWRAVAHVIGSAPVPRAVIFAGGTYADPLRIYVRNVSWVQPPARRVRIQEIDLVGAPKWLPRLRDRAPLGTRLIGHAFTSGSNIDRLALPHPITTSVSRLETLSRHLFRRRPRALLVFFQQPGP